jgi:hypothetical protein
MFPGSEVKLVHRADNLAKDFHDRDHWWKSFCVSIFITACNLAWISSVLSKHRPFSFNFILRNKKSHGVGSGK